MELWAADRERGLIRSRGERKIADAAPAFAICAAGKRIYCAGEKRGLCIDRAGGKIAFDFALPPGVCAMEAFGGSLCALSSETDSLTAFSLDSGEIRCAVPAGMYPRALSVSPCGRILAAAGGISGEIKLFNRNLYCLGRKKTRGVVCGACFLPEGLCALCAVEKGGEVCTRFVVFQMHGPEQEVFSAPEAPCSLCAFPDGSCLIGCHGRLLCLSPQGKIRWQKPCPYPARLRCFQGKALLCDGWQGQIRLLPGPLLLSSPAPEDALLLPSL